MNSAPSQTSLNMTSVPFNHGGTQVDLSFTWGVFETLNAEWGLAYQDNLAALFVRGDLTHLRRVFSLASGVAVTPDTVLPVQKTINALYRAYELGWSGRDVGPGPDETEEASGNKRKKLLPFAKSSTVTSRRGWRSVFRGRRSLP